MPRCAETFVGEGHVGMQAAMRAFFEAGVNAPLVEDHVPLREEGSGRQYRAVANAMGYIKALMDVARA